MTNNKTPIQFLAEKVAEEILDKKEITTELFIRFADALPYEKKFM